ncbi:DUF2294 domain-containing protein [Oscillatoria sp. FACHB-1406]|nr:DUF2294 domain-containing protein [Oscillatoria sp. FACHB-1406]
MWEEESYSGLIPSIYPTSGELERSLAQSLQALYNCHLGHRPQKLICHLFANKLAVVGEEAITPVEQLLLKNGGSDLNQVVRTTIESAIKPHLKALIEEILGVQVVELLCDTTLETGYTGILAILTQTPRVRNPNAIPKVKLERGQCDR